MELSEEKLNSEENKRRISTIELQEKFNILESNYRHRESKNNCKPSRIGRLSAHPVDAKNINSTHIEEKSPQNAVNFVQTRFGFMFLYYPLLYYLPFKSKFFHGFRCKIGGTQADHPVE